MRIAAFVTTFRRPQVLERTLARILGQTACPEAILVIDNGDCRETESVCRSLAGRGVRYHSSGENSGPAGGAATGVAWGIREGFDWLYWGDDDDPPPRDDLFERLIRAAGPPEARAAGLGAVGARWDWRRGIFRRVPDEELGAGPVAVDVIAGGGQLLLHLPQVRQIEPPDSRLFFEFEDLDFCLRLRGAGLELRVDGELMLEARRSAGRVGAVRRRSLVPRHGRANLWRRYYTTRNYVFLMRHRFGRPDLARREAARALVRSVASWLRGPRYALRFSHLEWAGVRDGWRGQLGRSVPPGATGTADAGSGHAG